MHTCMRTNTYIYRPADDIGLLQSECVILYLSYLPTVAAVHARDLVHRARVLRREGAVAHRDRGPRRTAALVVGAAGGLLYYESAS